MEDKFLQINSLEELEELEEELIEKYRNELYNKLLKNEEVKKHLCKILNISEKAINNALMINGYAPIDDFNEQ